MVPRVRSSPLIQPVVLYTDDAPSDLFFVQRAFDRQRPDLQLRTAVNGDEMIDYLLSALDQRPDHPMPVLAIMDLTMSVPDCFHILHWIRRTTGLSALNTVILSSSDRPGDRQRALGLGASHYIVKNCAFSEIPEIVASWLPPIPPRTLTQLQPLVRQKTHLPS